MPDRTSQQFGNYRLTRFLGSGGFAEVYLAEHIYLKTQAAIKLLQNKVANEVDLGSFLQEAQTIAALKHPHILRVLDFGVDAATSTPFLVMEYAPNGTLRNRHPRSSIIPMTTVLPYVKQVAAALQYAHNQKLIHRDIKPENILVESNNDLLLGDFGLATVARRTTTQSMQPIAGTALYMAPEQFKGKPRPASDQYALGIIVYEWLSGEPPFSEGDFFQLGYQHAYEPVPSLQDKIPSISSEVEQVVLKALAKDPERRFPSVQAFAEALEQPGRLRTIPPVSTTLSQPGQGTSPHVSQSGLSTSRNNQDTSSTPSNLFQFDRLWKEAIQAQTRGDIEGAFRRFREITTIPGLPASRVESIEKHIRRDLRQMIPLCLQRARKAVSQGGWQDEIQAWEDLLVLEPSQQEITERLVLYPAYIWEQLRKAQEAVGSIRQELRKAQEARGSIEEQLRRAEEATGTVPWPGHIPMVSGHQINEPGDIAKSVRSQFEDHSQPRWIKTDIEERLRIARQNQQSVWIYTKAQQFIRDQNNSAAGTQLKMLWNDAPFYGDPAALAQIVGLAPARNYQQALAEEQARVQGELGKLEQEVADLEWEAAENKRRVKKKYANIVITFIVSVGAIVGLLAGVLLVLINIISLDTALIDGLIGGLIGVIRILLRKKHYILQFEGATVGTIVGVIVLAIGSAMLGPSGGEMGIGSIHLSIPEEVRGTILPPLVGGVLGGVLGRIVGSIVGTIGDWFVGS
jgi:serine/threonine protein kinase